MITAIDTNILLDILVPNEDFYEASANTLQDADDEGSLVISDIVYLASRAWRTYRQQGGKRTRILADFLIGAHAKKQARDRGFYHKLFPSLDLHDPARANKGD